MNYTITAESIYIHIPFCKTKCPYCDFASWANKENLIEQYFDALLFEIRTKCEAYKSLELRDKNRKVKRTIKTIFIGGGTPSLVSPELYEKLFSELKKYFEINNDCEITMELNPGTAREDYLLGYKNLGVNRISIGAQSFNEKILETLGRKHSADETIDAINKIKLTGFTNFNLDLIFSVPGMTKDIWIESVYKALDFAPKHISAYSLIIEPGTPFEHIYKQNKNSKALIEDDFAFEFYSELCKILKQSGFIHYEVSNFAKPGYESKHNLTYWLAKEYFAFGVSAHRYLNGMRTGNTKNLEMYISSPNHETIIDYPINYNFEKIMLVSRLSNEFDVDLIEKVTTKNRGEIRNLLKDLSNEGFIELSRDKIHLTEKGLFVNNEILLKLI
ncbi:MAG: radical SAM family heme chaperone HemW [Candidatus Melainabacteria bacterium]|nr:radical SAM family heme chaperone HemW [Candidatus Melainabacteria bacterium]